MLNRVPWNLYYSVEIATFLNKLRIFKSFIFWTLSIYFNSIMSKNISLVCSLSTFSDRGLKSFFM